MSQALPMLTGYRVLDITQFVAGPTCCRILGEMGAEVVKLEMAPFGDRTRAGGFKPMDPKYQRTSQSTQYFQHNLCKSSIAMDLKNPRALELVKRMLPKFDVVVETLNGSFIALSIANTFTAPEPTPSSPESIPAIAIIEKPPKILYTLYD